MTISLGLLVTLEAQPGKGDELGHVLLQGRELALLEPDTVTWYAFRINETTYGIFDTFADEAGRRSHLGGPIASALGDVAPHLLATPPVIEPVDVLANKWPTSRDPGAGIGTS